MLWWSYLLLRCGGGSHVAECGDGPYARRAFARPRLLCTLCLVALLCLVYRMWQSESARAQVWPHAIASHAGTVSRPRQCTTLPTTRTVSRRVFSHCSVLFIK